MSDVPEALLPALGRMVLERTGDGRFVRLGGVPADLDGYFPGDTEAVDVSASAFLTWFLDGAEAVWAGDRPGPLASGPWTEPGADGEARTLEATALRLDGRDLLLVGHPAFSFAEAERVLQDRFPGLQGLRDGLLMELGQPSCLIAADALLRGTDRAFARCPAPLSHAVRRAS